MTDQAKVRGCHIIHHGKTTEREEGRMLWSEVKGTALHASETTVGAEYR